MEYLNRKIMLITKNGNKHILLDKITHKNETMYFVRDTSDSTTHLVSPFDIKDIKNLDIDKWKKN